MTNIKTIHIWMLDGRSLCDRKPYPATRGLTETEIAERKAEAAEAPACGACLLLASRIRREAAAILDRNPVVHPAKASEAWESLRETRWGNYFDLDVFRESAARVDEHTDYSAVKQTVGQETVTELVEQWDEDILRHGIARDQLGGKGAPTIS